MNRVYEVREKDYHISYAVGGENRTKAIINYLREIGENNSAFIYYRATLLRDKNGKFIYTENSGLLDIEELMPKGCRVWWDCPECGQTDNFEYAPIDKYKCCGCGYIGDIPFCD